MKTKMFVHGMMLAAFLLSCFAMPVATAQGEWKWANSWTGTEGNGNTYNYISNIAFDNDGNIYVWGVMGGAPSFNGQDLQFAYSVDGKLSSLLAKFDSLGNMLWYKVVKCNEDLVCFAHWMEVKNDRIYVSGNFELDYVDQPPVSGIWLYYFDTLITGAQVQAIPVEQREPPYKSGRYTYFATFDLDGNLLDNHFVEARARRISAGGIRGLEYLCSGLGYGRCPVHVDNDGNTYVYLELEYAGLESDPYTIIIDNDSNRTYDIYLPGSGWALHTGMMYKFSPNWELIYAKPMVEHTEGIATSWEWAHDSVNQRYNLYIEGMSFDEDDNMYVSGLIWLDLVHGWGAELHQYPIHIYWDSTHYATIYDESSCAEMHFLIKYSPDGDVLWCNQIHTRGSADPNAPNRIRSKWRGSCYESNYLYIVGCGLVHNEDAELAFDDQGHILIPYTYNNHTTAFFVRYNATTGQYVNHGIIPVENAQPGQVPDVIGNRLFTYSNKSAIHQWCVDGTYIDSINISYVHIDDLDRSSVLLDSKGRLLVGLLTKASGTFGDGVSFYGSSGRSNAVFALYHDPEFTTPYVGIADRGETLSNLKVWPNPTISTLYIESDNDPIDYITVMDLNGKTLFRQSVNDNSASVDVSRLPAGTYLLETACKGEISVEKFVKTLY